MWRRVLCFLRFHSLLRVERVYIIKGRPAPVPNYDGIPADAQVNARILRSYFVDLWEDHFICTSCEKEVRVVSDSKHGQVEYNRMVYIRNGEVRVATPALLQER